MLDRDLIRKRDCDYSAAAFGVAPEKREQLRQLVIQKYGKDLELIAPDTTKETKKKKEKGMRR